MGVVGARQLGLDRLVALKMVLAGPLASANERQLRMEAEAALDWITPTSFRSTSRRARWPDVSSMKWIDGDSLAQHLPRLR
jgi:hypothetical protein